MRIKRFKDIMENTSATGGSVAGSVVSAQPSGLAGKTIGLGWASNGGADGSGDISAPYNPSGSNRVFQKTGVKSKPISDERDEDEESVRKSEKKGKGSHEI